MNIHIIAYLPLSSFLIIKSSISMLLTIVISNPLYYKYHTLHVKHILFFSYFLCFISVFNTIPNVKPALVDQYQLSNNLLLYFINVPP